MAIRFGRRECQLTTSKFITHVINHGKICLGLFGIDWKRLTLAERKVHTPAKIFPLESCCQHPPQAKAKATSTRCSFRSNKMKKVGIKRCRESESEQVKMQDSAALTASR
eukprot:s192_g46.t1